MQHRVRTLLALALPTMLAGCISFSSSETPSPEYVNACNHREQQCQDICGSAGVQTYSCSAKPGEGFDSRCECRKLALPR